MLPEAFLERMQQMLGNEYEAFLESFHQERYQALRLNSLKVRADGRSAAEMFGLEKCRLEAEKQGEQSDEGDLGFCQFAHLTQVPWAENGYYYEAADQPGKHPYHEAGVYYIQEPSAMAPVELLDVQPGERVADLCAAPGGKSTQIAAKLQKKGFLLCNEIHPARAKILSENVERMGICNACVTNETPAHLAEIFPEYFDKILVDAPCSGEGMFRKNEAACEEWSLENVALCADRQDEILDCAARMLRPGGRLVYSTCTFAPAENEGSIGRFLQRHSEFKIISMEKEQLGLSGCDGVPEWAAEESEGSEKSKQNCVEQEGSEKPAQNSVEQEGSEKSKQNCEEQEGSENPKQVCEELRETLRLWPQRVKGEGHYAAVLQKAGSVPDGYHCNSMNGFAKPVSEKDLGEFAEFCLESIGGQDGEGRPAAVSIQETSAKKSKAQAGKRQQGREPLNVLPLLVKALGLKGDFQYTTFGDNLYLVQEEMPSVKGLKVLRPGLHLGEMKKNRFEPSHALALALDPRKAAHVWNLDSKESTMAAYLNGQTFPADGEKGWYLICVDGFGIGWGKLAGGVMKNHYPKGLRR